MDAAHPGLNAQAADRLREAAALLEAQEANPFRVGAYRKAADTLAALPRDIGDLIAAEGIDGLVALPGIGHSLAAAIEEMMRTGRWLQLDRLRGAAGPEQRLRTVPGIGPALAHRLHETLGTDTLEALELAAHDGRLERVPGIGPRRAAMIRATLAAMLQRRIRRPAAMAPEPPVAMLLDVDRDYRERSAAGTLRTIAPRRFNPSGKAWLPILHTQRGPWHFTALFSNTARAHELDRVRDWVVIYFHTDDAPEGQRTVVTETRGARVGQRVVRGRETE